MNKEEKENHNFASAKLSRRRLNYPERIFKDAIVTSVYCGLMTVNAITNIARYAKRFVDFYSVI